MAFAQEMKKPKQFKTRFRHRKLSALLRFDRDRPPGYRERPTPFRLDVAEGVEPSGKPPVRIFLGTEPAQYRAERVFIWSVIQVRDPSRVYEIHLMKDVKGFDRKDWKTSFTNYRYAIPTWAGGQGRAIYNDVDQIYFTDPGEMFDMEMGEAGVLGINGRETSVMLIDCAKMIRVWHMEDAQSAKRHKHFRAAMHDNNLWGPLPGVWNARDSEFVLGQSKLFHFTTLQTQPWQPFPAELKYRPHASGQVWFNMERAADAARFTVFTKDHPSQKYLDLLDQYRLMHEQGAQQQGKSPKDTFHGRSLHKHIEPIARLVRETGARSILDFGSGKAQLYQPDPETGAESRFKTMPQWPGVKVTCYDPGYAPHSGPYEATYDGVITTDVLEHIPEEDIAWVLDELFSHASHFVYAVAACYPAKKTLPNGDNAHCTVQSPSWWRGQLEMAARRYPGIKWSLCTIEKGPIGAKLRVFGGEGTLASAA